MTNLDPHTNQCELAVQMIIHLQNLANQLPDAFIDTKKVTKSHILAANTPARIDVLVGRLTNESKIRLKRGRPVGSKDVTPMKRRTQEQLGTLEETIKMTDQFKIDKSIAPEEAQIMQKALKRHILKKMASNIIRNDEDPEPRNVEECRHRNDWPKWKEAIQAKLNSLTKREVFGPVVQTPEVVKPVGEYLLKEGYVNNPICPCIFIKKSKIGFAIIAVYADDLNLVGTPKELTRTTNYLKKEFEMKDLGKTKFCLSLQIKHFPNGVLVHQSTYIKKVLKRIYMDKVHHLSSPMVVRSLDVKKDPFRPCEKDEELLGPEVPYLGAIGALMYLDNCIRPDIAFFVNLLARYSSAPTRRHWNDVGYLLDPHKGRSQIGYVFNYNGGYIKGDKTKHISPKFLYTHELQKSVEIVVQQIRSSDNLSNLFIKSLSTSTFKKLIHKIGMHQLKNINMRGSMLVKGC
ncbi:hypothetical protein AAG906_010173 [Vitis piasezkii]